MKGIIAGAFDIIHPGYIAAFKEAKQWCSMLFVFVQFNPAEERSDKLKPVLSVIDRMEILRSIKYIDRVSSYRTEDELWIVLKNNRWDVRFLGDDYKGNFDNITGLELNIPIHYLDRSHGWSETKLKKLICESMEKP